MEINISSASSEQTGSSMFESDSLANQEAKIADMKRSATARQELIPEDQLQKAGNVISSLRNALQGLIKKYQEKEEVAEMEREL